METTYTTADVVGGDPFLQTLMITPSKNHGVREVFHLGSGITVAMLRHNPDCTDIMGRESPALMMFSRKNVAPEEALFHLGLVAVGTGDSTWLQPPWTGILGATLVPIVHGSGLGLLRGFSTLSTTTGFSSSERTIIYAASSTQRRIASHDEQLVWASWDGPAARLAGWQPENLVLDVVAPVDAYVVDVAISEEHLVWELATGNVFGVQEGSFERSPTRRARKHSHMGCSQPLLPSCSPITSPR